MKMTMWAFISSCIFSCFMPTCTGQRQSFSALRGPIIPDTIEWTYGREQGPSQWPFLFPDSCAGIYQSPINIWTHNTIYDPSLKDFAIFYDPPLPGSRFEVHNNGHSIEVNTEGEFYVTNGGLRNIYKTGQFHFHWGDSNQYGSEHTIDGKAAPIEMHIVNWNKDEYSSFTDAAEHSGGLSVFGVLFELSQFDNPIFDQLIEVLQYIRDPDRNVLVKIPAISIQKLLPRLPDRYYRYNGSLTTPRCYESVIWTIFEQKQTISERQLHQFRLTLTSVHHINNRRTMTTALSYLQRPGYLYTVRMPLMNNFRPVQPLNGRTVFRSFPFLTEKNKPKQRYVCRAVS